MWQGKSALNTITCVVLMVIQLILVSYKVLSQYLPERIEKEHKNMMVGLHTEIQT
jgi:hypothetical protein